MSVTEIKDDCLDLLADCYVLCGGSKRTPTFARAFLDYFVPNRTETCEEYDFWLPDQLGPIATAEFTNADEAVAYMCAQPGSRYAIYWRNANESTLRFAMIFFLEEGSLIAGVSCNSSRNGSGLEEHYLKQLQDFCGSDVCYITYEEPPATTTAEFLQLAKR
jgi:hypothetical protein